MMVACIYYIYTYDSVCVYAYIHTYVHTYIHTYVHTYIHTCLLIWVCARNLEQVKLQQALNPFPSGFSIEAHQIPSPNMSREDKRYMILLVLGSMTNSASQTVGISKSDISTLENSEVSNRHGYVNSIPLTLNAHPRNYALGGDLQIFGTIETTTFAG